MSDLILQIAGKDVPFRHFVAQKSGAECWGVLDKKTNGDRYFSRYGVPVPALASDLPTSVVLTDGTTPVVLPLEFSFTDDSRPRVAHNAKVTLPNGQERQVAISISVTKKGHWNIKAIANSGGGGGGRLTSLADL